MPLWHPGRFGVAQLPVVSHRGACPPPDTDGENTDNLLEMAPLPHAGHLADPSFSLDNIRASKSFPHLEQVYSKMGMPANLFEKLSRIIIKVAFSIFMVPLKSSLS